MGTRGAYGFRIKNKDKVTYNHFDSYPSELGKDIVEFIVVTPLEEMAEIASNIELVKEGTIATPEQVENCRRYLNKEVSSGNETDWYCLLRKAQGTLYPYRSGEGSLKYMIDGKDFLKDSLFCEWAYIINLDSGMLEIYRGGNRNELAPGRYANGGRYMAGAQVVPTFPETSSTKAKYCGVALVDEIPLETIKQLDKNDVHAWCVSYEQMVTAREETGKQSSFIASW